MTSLYESLLLKMVAVLELTQQSEVALSPQLKQALVQSTNDFKESMRQAREAATTLPGGELSVAEQDEVIAMLERLKARKASQLAAFADSVDAISAAAHAARAEDGVRMEVDSTASTPVGP
ncbi:hypothetical protein B0H21DRAFT_426862 [Amylocystis lapponica]|nr:hypothetical protein B0H21DRAFT_426862 [Amylocystis lapponica]